MTKKENVLEKCRINLDKEKVLHSITRGERDIYKQKIDKAIEYITEEITKGTDVYCEEKVDGIIVLEILKGE